jgi:hypothetical protein
VPCCRTSDNAEGAMSGGIDLRPLRDGIRPLTIHHANTDGSMQDVNRTVAFENAAIGEACLLEMSVHVAGEDERATLLPG